MFNIYNLTFPKGNEILCDLFHVLSIPLNFTFYFAAFNHKDYMHIQFEGGKGGNNLRKPSDLVNNPSGGISYGIVSGNVLAGTEFHGASQVLSRFYVQSM